MKYIYLLIFLVSYDMALASNASLGNLQIEGQTLNFLTEDIVFPRDYELRYRGLESELYSLEDFLKSFIGDKDVFVESLEFSAVRMLLEGKWWHDYNEDPELMPKMRKFFCKDYSSKNNYDHKSQDCRNLDVKYVDDNTTIRQFVDRKISENKGYFNRKNASRLAKKILDIQFQHENKSSKESRLVNYRSGRYQDFPVDVLFSTIYQQNAMIYGDTILVLKESDNRSIDLSYYNGITNNSWGFKADAGEYITPGYIESNEINGIYLRSRGEYPDKLRNQVPIAVYKDQKNSPIEYAFYKYSIHNVDYILIFDGSRGDKKTKCINSKNNDFRHCNWESPMHNNGAEMILGGYQPVAKSLKYVPNLIAILTVTKNGSIAPRPEHIFSKFQYLSDDRLDKLLQNSKGVGEKLVINTINSFKHVLGDDTYGIELHWAK